MLFFLGGIGPGRLPRLVPASDAGLAERLRVGCGERGAHVPAASAGATLRGHHDLALLDSLKLLRDQLLVTNWEDVGELLLDWLYR